MTELNKNEVRCHVVQEFNALLLILWHLWGNFSAAKYEKVRSKGALIHSKNVLAHLHMGIPGPWSDCCLCREQMSAEAGPQAKWQLWMIGAAGIALAGGGLACPLPSRLPTFSCVSGVPIIFHCLVSISLENKESLCS